MIHLLQKNTKLHYLQNRGNNVAVAAPVKTEVSTPVKTQLERIPLDFPKIEIKRKNNLEDFLWEDINVLNYKFYESIKAKMIV